MSGRLRRAAARWPALLAASEQLQRDAERVALALIGNWYCAQCTMEIEDSEITPMRSIYCPTCGAEMAR